MIPMLAALSLVVLPAITQLPTGVFQPTDYTSAAGECTLHVEPSHSNGTGPMHCKLIRGNEERWSADFAWMFESAGVAADGTAVGYHNGGDLRIAVIDAKGTLRKEHVIPHTIFLVDGPALPLARGEVLVHSSAGLAFVRVLPANQSRPAPWKVIRLADGEFAEDVLPAYPIEVAQGQSLFERGARVIGDTGLTLCQWWAVDFRREDLEWPKYGGVFSLCDLRGQVVWRLPLLEDYTDRTSKEATERLSGFLDWMPMILATGPGNRFAIRAVKEQQRIEFDVQRSGDSDWRVLEVGRSPYAPDKQVKPEIERLPLKLLECTMLAGEPVREAGSIHDVGEFGVTPEGELEIFRYDHATSFSYARLTSTGALVFERDLSSLLCARGGRPSIFKLAGDRWLLQCSRGDPPWLEVDVRTGELHECPLAECDGSASVAAEPDGGYLALLHEHDGAAVVTELMRVTAERKVGWRERVGGMGPNEPAFRKLVSGARCVARTGDGRFMLLDSERLTTIDAERQVLGTTRLESVLGRRPGYVDGLRTDPAGGVYFGEGDSVWRLDAHGTLAGRLEPRRPDGSRDPSLLHLLRIAPDGTAWTSDRMRIYRLDALGHATVTLGPALRPAALESPGTMLVDGLGRVLIQDSTTLAVHVFDSLGKPLFVASIEAAERPEHVIGDTFHVSRDGTLQILLDQGIAAFDLQGRRAESAPETAGEAGSLAPPQPKRGKYRSTWGIWEEVERADPVLRRLWSTERRPDGKWFDSVVDRCANADGNGAIFEAGAGTSPAGTLHLYASDGSAVASVDLGAGPRGHVATLGTRWATVGGSGPDWILVRLADRKVFRLEVDSRAGQCLGQTPDGSVLLLVDRRARTLARYELP